MKKIIILLIMVFLLTGCKATVNLSIDKDTVDETVNLTDNNSSEFSKIKSWGGFPVPLYYDQELEAPLWMPNREKEAGVSYYNVDYDDTENTIVVSGKFSKNQHNRSSLVRRCFNLYNVVSEGNTTIFSTSKGLICSFKNFDIVVNTPYTVINNNATKVDRETNTYTWNVNRSNANDIGIYLEIDFSKKYNQSQESIDDGQTNNQVNNTSKKTNSVIIYTVLGIISVILVVGGTYLYKKNKNVSNI